MQEKAASKLIIILLLVSISVSIQEVPLYGMENSIWLSINPPMQIAVDKGERFEETIDIVSSEELWCVEFVVTYDPLLLEVTDVLQGSFFSGYVFDVEQNASSGLLNIRLMLFETELVKSGNGTLASIVFEAIGVSETPSYCPISLDDILVLNSSMFPVACDSVGALYFWKTLQPDPPIEGRMVDVYTQRGGIGLDQPDGEFVGGEVVILYAFATYNDFPVQHVPVAFQALNPLNEIVAVLSAFTDEDGIAQTQFRLPHLPKSEGVWTAIATVDIACTVVWDTVTFTVEVIQVVGGYTDPAKTTAAGHRFALYLSAILILTALVVVSKRKTIQKLRG